MRRSIAIGLISAAVAVGGCGNGSHARREQNASLILDFTPNAIHAGIYSALARHFDTADGLTLHVEAPSATTDSIKLLESGKVNFAILDIHDLAIARERGEDIVAIMAIVERPLAAVIAAPSIRSPRELQGKTVGITGVPSDTAVLHSIVSGAGGDPAKVKTITIGYNAVDALLSGRVAAATAFWNDEGVTIQSKRPGFHVFRVDQYGAPRYPELVLCATASTLKRHPAIASAVVRTLTRGYDVTLADPQASEHDLESIVPGLDGQLVASELKVEEPALRAPDGRFGELDLGTLRAWAKWEARFGIVKAPPNVTAMFDPQFVQAGASPAG
jgi:ABC-type nitrate/sulfonate/bicarbonate transport system substrate-binding protein